jgi:hypothetical protein
MSDPLLDIIQGAAVPAPQSPQPAQTLSRSNSSDPLLSIVGVTQQPQAQAQAKQPGPAVPASSSSAEPTSLFDGLGHAAYGLAKGAADWVQGPAQLVLHGSNWLQSVFPDDPNRPMGPAQKLGQKVSDNFDASLKKQEDQYQADTKGSWAAGLGRFASGAAPFIASSGVSGAPAVATKAPLLGAMLKAGAQGAGLSAIQPVHDVSKTSDGGNDFLAQKGLQTALGGGFGAMGAPIGRALARIVSPEVSQGVKTLLNEGVTPTLGQMLGGAWARTEDKLTSVPFVGDMIKSAQRRGLDDLNRAAYARALSPIGEKSTAPVGREGVAEVKDKLGAAYNTLLPKLSFSADPQFISGLNKVSAAIQNGNVPPAVSDQFHAILKNEVASRMTPQGLMSGQSFKEMEQALGQKIKQFGANPDPSNQAIANGLREVLDSARQGLARSNPQHAQELSAINQGYANYARIRSAASALGADSGVFTPAQLQNAVKASDKSVGKGNFATGNALMQDLSEAGKSVLGSKYPDSGTAGRSMLGLLGGAGAAMATGHVSPLQVAGGIGLGGLASLPYTKLGQRAAVASVVKRPDAALPLANALRAGAPAATAAASPTLLQLLEQWQQ